VQLREQTALGHVFKHDYNVGNVRHDAHEKGDVWVAQDTLHDNFVLNFTQQLVRHIWVEDFLDCHWRPI